MQCIRKKRTNCILATLSYFELYCVTLVHSPFNANAQGCIKNNEPLSSNSRASFFFFFLLFVEEHLSSLKESSAASKIRNPQNVCKVQTRTSLVRMVKFICMFTRPFKDKEYGSIETDGYLYL